MLNKKNYILFVVLTIAFCKTVKSQAPNLNLKLETSAIITSNNSVPFWMRANQHGSIPSHGISGSFLGSAYKEYDSGNNSIIDWGAGFEGRANVGEDSKLILLQAYVKAKAGIFQLKAGRSNDILGLIGDSTLSSGSFSMSGNALGIPKIELSIPEYYPLSFLGDVIAIKGTFSHGWLGQVKVLSEINGLPGTNISYPTLNQRPTTYLHQKSFYGRIGRPDSRLKLHGGFNHQVFWGNEKRIYGDNFDLSNLESFFHVIVGKTYGSGLIPRSKIGNQLGSIDIGIEYDFNSISIFGYRQNFYDVGALSKLANIKDGLNGIAITNKAFVTSTNQFRWKKIVLELLYTKHQAGEFGSKRTESGDEDYYNNYFYLQGWSYKGLGLGTPFISTKASTRNGLPSFPGDYFINNRVIAFHTGIEATVSSWDFIVKASYSKNFGTFGTSPEGHSTGEIKGTHPSFGLFGSKKQFSGFLESNRSIKNGLRVGYTVAFDSGQLLDNSVGFMLKASKSF